MKRWWLRPVVRLCAALLLPAAVPLVITLLIWALPGDPAEIICPPQICGGTEALAERWNLDRGPLSFYGGWVGSALDGEFGRSWRVQQGVAVSELLHTALPNTLLLFLLAATVLCAGTTAAALGLTGRRLDVPLFVVGLVPVVVWALLAAAWVDINYGATALMGEAANIRLVAGAIALGLADGALSGAVMGTRALFEKERRERYVRVAVLRGEGILGNTLVNVAPSLAGQLRARLLHLLSGAVIVEVVLRIDGIGDLLWRGTLLQDFGVVLATATVFALVSSALLAAQALVEVATALAMRRSPALSVEAA